MRIKALTRKALRRYSSNSNHFCLTETSSFVFRIHRPCLWHRAKGKIIPFALIETISPIKKPNTRKGCTQGTEALEINSRIQ